MKAIIRREIKNYLTNPIYVIGIFFVIVSIYGCLKPYLEVGRYVSESDNEDLQEVNVMDADIMEGYIPVSEEKQLEIGLNEIKKSFIKYYGMNEQEAENAILDVKNQGLSIQGTIEYLENNYEFYDGKAVFLEAKYEKGNTTEVNNYIDARLNKHTYSYYFAKKYADFAGLHFAFFACVLLSFLYIRDMKKDIYELLHTKPVSEKAYVWGKFLGGVLSMLLPLFGTTLMFSVVCQWHASRAGMNANMADLFIATFLYVVPTILIVNAIYTMLALLFRNPVPALPLILAYIIYSNMGGYDKQGNYGFHGKIFGMLFRFEGRFFETKIPAVFTFNQIMLLLLTVIFVFVATNLWKRRTI